MDSGNMPEVVIESDQPDDVVVTDSEVTEATPQAEATDKPEVIIEGDDDQQETSKGEMSDTQLKAAWREEREKRKRKNQELEEAKQKQQELEERLKKAEELAIKAALGDKPNPEDFLDATDYAQALEKYNKTADSYKPQAAKPEQKPEAQNFSLSDDQEFFAYKSREELKKAIPDYDDAEKRIDEVLRSNGLPVERVKNGLIALSHLHDIDYAKAMFALDAIPSMQAKLAQAQNDLAIAKVLKEAAAKITIRQPATIETQPEPTLSSSGSVDASNQAVLKAREVYAKNPSTVNFAKLQEAKRKAKGN